MRRGAAVIAAALAVGCLDASGPGLSGRAQLIIVPQFDEASASRDGTPSDVDSFVVTVSRPPDPDLTVYARIPPGQDSIVLSIPIDVTGGADTVNGTFEGFSSTTGMRLYSGTFSSVVVVGQASVAPAPVSYVGPGRGVDSIAVTPRLAADAPGATTQLTYAAFDTAGVAMHDDSVPVTWITRSAGVATVTAGGLVTAVSPGTATIVVRAVARSAVRDSARVTVIGVPPPIISFSPGSVSIVDTLGSASPADAQVNVSNSGGGSLTGLAAGTISYAGGGSGWLTATLSAASAPAVLTLSFNTSALGAGVHTASVPVSASGGVPAQSLAVSLDLRAAIPIIQLAPATITIPDTLGTAPPASRTINITNGGSGTLTALTMGAINYSAGATGWLGRVLSGAAAPATITLTFDSTGVPAGTHTATFTVSEPSAINNPQTVTVTWQLASGLIQVTPSSVAIVDTVGTSVPGAVTLNVANVGGGNVTALSLGPVTYTGASGWMTRLLSGPSAPAQITIGFDSTGVPAGTHTATFAVIDPAAGNSPQTVTVTWQLLPPPVIALNPTSVTFQDTVGTPPPAAASVAITNAGGLTLTGIVAGSIAYGPGGSNWLALSPPGATAPTSLTLTPNWSGLAAGTYTATLAVAAAAASNTPQTITITLDLAPSPLVAIAVTPGFSVLRTSDVLALTVTGTNAIGLPTSPGTLTYVSRNPAVATVSPAGVVTAVGQGSATIAALNGTLGDSLIVAVVGTGSPAASVIAAGRGFAGALVGDTVRLDIAIDIRTIAPDLLGGYTGRLDWNPAVLRYVRTDVVGGGFATPTLNTGGVTTGELRFGAADPAGHAGPSVALMRVIMVAQAPGSAAPALSFTDITAAVTFNSYLSATLLVPGSVVVR